MSKFTVAVTDAFRTLLRRGLLSIESSAEDPFAFGNAVVLLTGPNLRLRLVLDRGDTFAEAASQLEPENWFPLQRVIQAVGVYPAPPEGLLTPQQVADLIDRHFVDLDAGLGRTHVDNTKRRLADLECAATKRLVGHARE
jgi:hypothetical protein